MTILVFGGDFTCCLAHGYGLGDIVYVAPMFVLTILYLVLIVVWWKKMDEKWLMTLFFGVVIFFYIRSLAVSTGFECPCELW